MRILLDECLPRKLKYELSGYPVETVPECGWAGLKNGVLLNLVEPQFDVFITGDQNLKYQQNLRNRDIGIIILVAPNNRFATLRPLMPQVQRLLESITPGIIKKVSA